jgi:hypothetical protein
MSVTDHRTAAKCDRLLPQPSHRWGRSRADAPCSHSDAAPPTASALSPAHAPYQPRSRRLCHICTGSCDAVTSLAVGWFRVRVGQFSDHWPLCWSWRYVHRIPGLGLPQRRRRPTSVLYRKTENSVDKLHCVRAVYGQPIHRFVLGARILSGCEGVFAYYGGCLHPAHDHSSCYRSSELRTDQ